MVVETPELDEYIPKKDTQLEEFLKKYPEYDGRGIKIAIFDSAIDASLPGLQTTTTGQPKIIDSFNFCDDVKVDTSIVREMDGENILEGLSGRTFKIPSKWQNPSGKWHLGCQIRDTSVCHKKVLNEADIKKIVKKRFYTIIDDLLLEAAVADYIVWHDGEKYLACIPPKKSDDLEDAKVLIDENDNGLIEIHEEGNLLTINTSKGCSHGSYVTKVAAAHFPDEPQKNGTAPGAQIISMNVWSKYSYTSPTISFKNAVSKCIELGVDIIVASYNLSKTPNIGNIIKDIMVEKHGIIIVKAASNFGPCYSSLTGDYCNYLSNIFVVGAVLTPEMMEKYYKFNEKIANKSILFSYSAKGPVKSGRRGIDFVAPGDAIIGAESKPEYASGTSLAAPNAAGAIACLLSALKANSIEYNPTMLKLALSNTAYLPDGSDKLGFGDGIIQINAAFEYLKNLSSKLNFCKIPKLTVTLPKKKFQIQEGIYLVQKDCDRTSKTYSIKINKINNNEILWLLKTESNGAKFIKHSDTVINGMFTVDINPISLIPGSINYTEIYGYDSANISFGPLFKFPITVIISKFVTENEIIKNEISLIPEIPYSIFLHLPPEKSQCTVTVTALDENISEKITFIYAAENNEHCKYFTPEKDRKILAIPLTFCDQMFQISIFRYNYYSKEASNNLKFKLEITFEQENFVSKICKKKKSKKSGF